MVHDVVMLLLLLLLLLVLCGQFSEVLVGVVDLCSICCMGSVRDDGWRD